MPLTPAAERELLTSLLKQVSRSFYLTLRVLPRTIRRQIGLAYLLARTTDTIADTGIIPVTQRLDALHRLRERILGVSSADLNFGSLAREPDLPAERVLLERVGESLELLRALPESDLKLVRQVLDTIVSGQELDLRRFDGASEKKIVALQNGAELDDYTYRVAGCVGKFWTEMCLAHVFRPDELPRGVAPDSFEQMGIRFGKGLQLVNILRDVPADLRNGRCYFPAEKLADAGLTPSELLTPTNEAKFRPLYDRYLDLAESHLTAGWQYTNHIAWGRMNLRLACAWPVLIGLKTVNHLRAGTVLDPLHRIKASRTEVRGIMVRSVLLYPFPAAWRRLGLRT